MKMNYFSSLQTQQLRYAIFWSLFLIVCLTLALLTSPMTFFKMDAVALWVIAIFYFLHTARKEVEVPTPAKSIKIILLGLGLAIYSFVSIPLGLGNPPYSIGDFSIFLSGISLLYAASQRNQNYFLPLAIPAIGVLGFEFYDLFIQNQEWISSPIIPFVIGFTVLILQIIGVSTYVSGNMISITSSDGDLITLLITSDCSGLWSLGTFTLMLLIVYFYFKRPITPNWLIFVGVGYLGTILTNILRIVGIAVVGYLFGNGTIIQVVHLNIGWILFYTWMAIFWYVFFTRYLGFEPPSIILRRWSKV